MCIKLIKGSQEVNKQIVKRLYNIWIWNGESRVVEIRIIDGQVANPYLDDSHGKGASPIANRRHFNVIENAFDFN